MFFFGCCVFSISVHSFRRHTQKCPSILITQLFYFKVSLKFSLICRPLVPKKEAHYYHIHKSYNIEITKNHSAIVLPMLNKLCDQQERFYCYFNIS